MAEPFEWSRDRMEFKPVTMNLNYKGGMKFTAETSTGLSIPIDAHAHLGGEGATPNPIDYLITSLGGCIGVKILLCLKDNTITPEHLTISLNATRKQDLPAVFDAVHVVITLKGTSDTALVAGILEKTMTLLCPISAMFGELCDLTWEYHLE